MAVAVAVANSGSTPGPSRVARVLGGLQVLAASALLGLIALLLAGTAPSVLGFESFVVLSGSMEPAIMTGDVAVVAPTTSSDLRVGDIITYRTPQQPDVIVTHRLISVGRDDQGRSMFETKGDANSVPDQVPVESGAVLGKVVYSLPKVGYLVTFARNTEGKLALIALPGLLLVADYLRSRPGKRGARRQPAVPPVSAHQPPVVAHQADTPRIRTLLERGRQALEAGYPELATRAADGVLTLDARNEDAWLLKVAATPELSTRAALLEAALRLNPAGERLAAELQAATAAA